ncbi:MAG: helix-turn-helix transcriptional regulator [Bacillota bacterium]
MFKDWWCVAGPINDPSGDIIGYLDISMYAEKELGPAVALLKTLIALIEKEFLLLELQQKLKQMDVKITPSPALPSEIERELTLREREVAELLLSRLTNEEIAQRLQITAGTLKTHRKNIFYKLGVHNLNELLSRYCRK